MTEPTPEGGIDFSQLQASDAAPIVPPEKPDHTQSREKKPRGFGRARTPAGDRADGPTRRTPAAKPKKHIPNRQGQFVEPLEQFYTAIGVTLMPFDAVCANALISAAPACAKSLDELAYRNESFRRIIFALVNTSAIGAVIAAHLPILFAIAMHHVPAVQNLLGGMGAKFAADVEQNMHHGEGEADAA